MRRLGEWVALDYFDQQIDQEGPFIIGQIRRGHLPAGTRPLPTPFRFELRLAASGSSGGSGMSLALFHVFKPLFSVATDFAEPEQLPEG
jgi:hypothetical protein